MKSFKRVLKLYTQCSPMENSFYAHSYCMDKLHNGKVWGIEGTTEEVDSLLTSITHTNNYTRFRRLNEHFYFNKDKEKVVWL